MIKENDYKQCKCGKYYLVIEGNETECEDCLQRIIEEHRAYVRKRGKNYMPISKEDVEKYIEGDMETLYEDENGIYVEIY